MTTPRAMGARKPGSQGERDISVKTIAQGMPDDLAEPVVTAASFFVCWRAMGEAVARHSLRPLRFRGRCFEQDSDELRRESAESCFEMPATLSVVITRESG
jgi:hypothetical protein